MGTTVTALLTPLWHRLPSDASSSLHDSASWSLPPSHASVGDARRFTRETLVRWRLGEHEELAEGVCLAVSELVTNALRHAFAHLADPMAEAGQLHLMRWSRYVVCAVRDASDASPVAGAADSCAESGRGLQLVEHFSDSWGWHRLTDAPHGKVVWALFRLP